VGPFVVVLMGLVAIVVGSILIVMKDGVSDAYRASTKITKVPKAIYTPTVVRFTGFVFLAFGLVFMIIAIALFARG